MRAYERNGVTVDQCTECRGIFLDKGELERLTSAENSWHGAPPPQQQSHQSHQSHQQPQYQQGYSYGGHPHHKKKHKSFFEELFD